MCIVLFCQWYPTPVRLPKEIGLLYAKSLYVPGFTNSKLWPKITFAISHIIRGFYGNQVSNFRYVQSTVHMTLHVFEIWKISQKPKLLATLVSHLQLPKRKWSSLELNSISRIAGMIHHTVFKPRVRFNSMNQYFFAPEIFQSKY